MNFASEIGFEYIATGHYAQIEEKEGTYVIKKGHDKLKDQSYMLWDIDHSQLSKTIFPIGSLTKDQVREYASKHNLETANRNESQDLCFVLDNDYNQFLNEIAPEKMKSIKEGPIEDEDGNIVGQHSGFTKYTVGQRKGLGLSYPEPRYVKKINPINNTLTIGTKKSLFSKECTAHEINFFIKNIKFPKEVDAKIRYNSKSSPATIKIENKDLIIKFSEPQLAITPGQSIVFYSGEQMIGGAIIK